MNKRKMTTPPNRQFHELNVVTFCVLAQGASQSQYLLAMPSATGRARHLDQNLATIPQSTGPARRAGLQRIISGWQLCPN
jgi:hypothetical protein